jgi:formylglycine-generating enzyme required for sulfatase activity/dienelactone hydrolase
MSESAKAIFLSYASQDADAAKRICDVLRAVGLEVWFDQSELRGGDAWDASIRRQVRECALFVPIISANTEARSEGYFRREWNLAVQRMLDMSEDQTFLLPVVIDDTREATARVPERFRERQWSRVSDAESAKAFAARALQLGGGSAGSDPMNRLAPKEPTPPLARTQRPRALVGAIAVTVVAAVFGSWVVIDHNRKAAFVTQSLAQIESLSRSGKYFAAFQLARDIERAGGADALTDQLKDAYSRPVNVVSTPPGATLSLRPYRIGTEDPEWIELGISPLEKFRVPRGPMQWRATMPGYASASQLAVALPNKRMSFVLLRADPKDSGMVQVNGGAMEIGGLPGLRLAEKVTLAPYLIDRTEVTNREYAQFVRAGGYAREDFWKEPFREGARTLAFKEAVKRFKDATGRAGPATWKLGNFPDGEDDLPVRGISWYEAAAYATYAGKELPTIYHWYFADTGGDLGFLPGVLMPAANFQGGGLRTGAAARAISAYGAVNMAGNVREWVSNSTDKQRYMAVGGSWTDVPYLYSDPALHSGFDRPLDAGLRCMKRQDGAPLAGEARASLTEIPRVDSTKLKPVSDAEYAVYTRFFEQRRIPLDARIESSDDSSLQWTLHRASYAAGYGGERLSALLYLPKNAKPPYQTIIYMTGSNALQTKQALDNATATFGLSVPKMLVLGGRAVLIPVWKGMYERSDGYDESRADRRGYYREHILQWVSELRQSLEFLRTRPEIDHERIGFHGASLGAMWAPVFLALEPRLKTGILLMGGLIGPLQIPDTLPPEMNPATFAPRANVPVLMLNGRDDLIFIYETAQVPLFKLLGSPANKKKHKIYPGGHSVFGWYDEMVRDTLEWLDEQFGPVTPAGQK